MNDKRLSNDIADRLALAWGAADERRRGPKRSSSLDDVVAAAIGLADEDGLGALTMQRVAERIGMTTMAVYRYVPSKEALVFLAVDAASGSPPAGPKPGEGWRPALERWARAHFVVLGRHPWIGRVSIEGPPLGPNQIAWMERGLECLDGTDLSVNERLGAILLVEVYILGHHRLYDELSRGAAAEGLTPDQAERAYAELVGQILDAERFPRVAAAYATLAGQEKPEPPEADFEFGLRRVLDGIEQMIAAAEREAEPAEPASPA